MQQAKLLWDANDPALHISIFRQRRNEWFLWFCGLEQGVTILSASRRHAQQEPARGVVDPETSVHHQKIRKPGTKNGRKTEREDAIFNSILERFKPERAGEGDDWLHDKDLAYLRKEAWDAVPIEIAMLAPQGYYRTGPRTKEHGDTLFHTTLHGIEVFISPYATLTLRRMNSNGKASSTSFAVPRVTMLAHIDDRRTVEL